MRNVRLLLCILVVFMLISVTGCGSSAPLKNKVVKLLNEKYSDSFCVKEVQSTNFLDGFYTVIAYQEDNPERPFSARIKTDGSGVEDTYVLRLISTDLSDTVTRNLSNLSGDFYVYCIPSIDYELPYKEGEQTFSRYIRENPNMDFGVSLFFCPDNTETELLTRNLSSMFSGIENLNGNLHLYFVDGITLNEIKEYLESNDRMYQSFYRKFSPYMAESFVIENSCVKYSEDDRN